MAVLAKSSGNRLVVGALNRRLQGSGGGLGSGDYADATITVTNGIAATTVSAVSYTWPVEPGGSGAAAGKLGYEDGYGIFTYSSVDYRWPVIPTGSGGASITVTNGIATISVGSDDIEWAVDPA